MIKEIKLKIDKYKNIAREADYVSVAEVISDLSFLEWTVRVKRIPKDKR